MISPRVAPPFAERTRRFTSAGCELGLAGHIAAAAILGRVASAEPIAGTADDPIRELAIEPGVADTPNGLAIRGGAVVDTVVLVDGFSVPWLDHISGVRSIFAPRSFEAPSYHPAGFDVAYGGGTSLVDVTTHSARGASVSYGVLASGYGLEPGVAVSGGSVFAAARASSAPALPTIGDSPNAPTFADAQLRVDHRIDDHWALAASAVGALDDAAFGARDDAAFVRTTLAVGYRAAPWQARLAVSAMPVAREVGSGDQHLRVHELALDSRGELQRAYASLAGLADVLVRAGAQTSSTRYDLDIAWPYLPREGLALADTPAPTDTSLVGRRVMWREDAALWAAVAASVSPDVRAEVGVRLDLFGDDLATQPRGSLTWQVTPSTRARLAAGAYRRPPEQLDELLDDTLHPERTTQIDLSVAHTWVTGSLYYIDRTRLIIRDGNGVLHNTGSGTSLGAEASARAIRGRWHARAAIALAKSVRQDHVRAAVRPAESDQPFRFDAIVGWRYGAWQLGARLRLASGLPYTPVGVAVYDSDHDYYEPLFGEVYSARLPFQHQLDVRVDRRFGRLAAFLDLHDAYASRAALGYFYSFDYRERFARYLPVFPFIGIGGTL